MNPSALLIAQAAAWTFAATQGFAATALPAPVAVSCATPLRQPLPAPGQSLTLSVSHDGLLSIIERGQELDVRGNDVVEIATPPRLGRFSLLVRAPERVQVGRARPGAARGQVEIILDCQPTDETNRMHAWQARVQAFEREIAKPLTADAYDRLLPQIDAIRNDAAPGYPRTLASHLRAQALLATGRSADAAAAFAAAKQAWLAVDDRERALAALVGQAEDLQRAGAYGEVITLAGSLGQAPDRTSYFSVRLENSRCLALEYLNRLNEAAQCYQSTIGALAELGETLERVSAQQDYAGIEIDRGRLEHATELATASLASITGPPWNEIPGPDIPVVRGRLERMLGELSIRRGDVATGLRHSQRALAEFDQAQHPRWQANMLLRIGAIYSEIGAYADAIDAVDAALQRLSSRDAPERIAAAELTKADVELAAGSVASASELASQARAGFESLQMPADAAAASLTMVEAQLAAGHVVEARAALDAISVVPPGLSGRAELVRAEIGAVDSRATDSKSPAPTLATAGARPISEWLRVQVVLAKRMAAGGDRRGALRLLEEASAHLADIASNAGNPVLRSAIERRQRQLVSSALSIVASGGTMDERVDAAWHWLLMSEHAPPHTESTAHSAASEQFDRALAESLLRSVTGGSADAQLQRHLLEVVADARTTQRTAPQRLRDFPRRSFQAMLPQGTMFIALLGAGSSQALLAISADSAGAFFTHGDLRKRALDFAAAAAGHEDLRAIDQAAAELSRALFGTLDGTPVPQRLLVFAPEPFNALPWPLLRWPGEQAALLETSSVTLVVPAEGSSASNYPVAMHAFSAATRPDGSALPSLAAAGGELTAITEERKQHGWRILARAEPSRAAMLAALHDPGSWVHVAGHGSSSTDYVGRSGLWLAGAEPNGKPDLLSWVDIVEHGVQADVVVLNACALGGSPASSLSASSGFADAMLRAGARDVVAALWPIDDTAASLWASAFYAQLPPQPATDDIAAAVRASMLRLRDTRTFRHPRYWASLVHLARVDLPWVPAARPAN